MLKLLILCNLGLRLEESLSELYENSKYKEVINLQNVYMQ